LSSYLERRRLAQVAAITALLLLYVFSSLIKLDAYKAVPAFNPEDDTGLFSSESAFQYRYARLCASGEKIPEIDRFAQWPEGLRVRENITVMMEYVSGFAYRIATRLGFELPFHVFLIGFICFWSSLSIFPLYFLSLNVWRKKIGALLSIAFYAVSVAVFDRSVGNFLREDFTLVLIFGSLTFFVYSVTATTRKRALCLSVLAGLCLFFALGSWHLTQFFFLLFSVGVAICALIDRGDDTVIDGGFEGKRKTLLQNFAVLTAFAVMAGLAFPVLRSRLFFVSHPLVISYSLVLAGRLAGRYGFSRVRFASILVGLSTGAGILVWLFTRGYLEYSHVYGVIIAKLMHFGLKPDNPSAISYDARVFWQGPFASPGLASILFYFSHILPASAFPVVRLVRGGVRRNLATEKYLLLFLVFSFFALYLLMERMSVFFVFFLCCVAGGCVQKNGKTAGTLALIVAIAGLTVGATEMFEYKGRTGIVGWYSREVERVEESTFLRTDLDRLQLVSWIRGATEPGAVLLTWMAEGPDLLTDTGRPINLHSMFEAREIREKNYEFLSALYSREEQFYKLFSKFEADYFVYEADFILDTSKESPRYVADALRLSRASAAFQFHFMPDSLKHFVCVYENRFYRVFGQRQSKPAIAADHRTGAFSLSLFEPGVAPGTYLDNTRIATVSRKLMRGMKAYMYATQLNAQGKTDEAYVLYRDAVATDSTISDAWVAMARISASAGNVYRAELEFKECLKWDPSNSSALADLGCLYVSQGNTKAGIALLEESVSANPQNAVVRFNLAGAYSAEQRFDDAIREYETAILMDPSLEPAYVSLGRIYAFRGRMAEAVAMWEKALTINPDDEEAQALLSRAEELMQ